MFAVVDIAGFQEIVKEGATLRVPLHADDSGKKIKFENVLLVADGDKVTFGAPYIAGATIEVEVIKHGKEDKVRIQKFQRRKRYRRVKGHRQAYTEVKVTGIKAK